MHCAACERFVETQLVAAGGVSDVKANAVRGFVEYTINGRLDRPKVVAALDARGYHLGERPYWLNRTPRVWRDLAIGVAIVAIVAVAARAGAFGFVSGWLDGLQGASLALPLLVGVAAGFSTCLATVGGLVLAASANASARPGGIGMRPHLWFNAGRILGFAGLGVVVGAIGNVVTLGKSGFALAMLASALIMVMVSLQLTTVSPRLAGLTPTIPRWARRFTDTGSPRRSHAGSDASAASLGALSFFVPCGFTQAVQIYALSTGSPLRASLILAAFALGTAPALLTLGGAPLLARGSARETFLRVAGVTVAAFATINIVTALGILGVGPAIALSLPDDITPNVTIVDGVQVAAMTTDGSSYTPADTVVYVGMPVRWEVTGTGLACASWIVAPELGVPADAKGAMVIPGKTSVFEFTLTQPGTIEFACIMDMYRGTMTAIPQPKEASAP